MPYGWFTPYGWFRNPWFSAGGNSTAKLEIYQMVAVHLGEPVVTSLTDPTKIVALISSVYPSVRDNLLRDHPWNFAIVREELVGDATPIYGYDYSYLIPPDCMRVVSVEPDDVVYVIEGQTILCDEDTLSLRYVQRITDETLWDTKFTHAMAATVAAKICYNLTGSHQRELDLLKIAELYVPDAAAVGGIEEPVEDTESWYDTMVS